MQNALSTFLGLGILVYFGIMLAYLKVDFSSEASGRLLRQFFQYSFVFVSFLFIVFLFIFFAFLTYSILYLSLPKNKDYDFIIIHGSGLINGNQVPPLLAARIDKAMAAYQVATKDNVQFIASGGKGGDETISEAEGIANYLVTHGISPDRIILEKQSTTTYENLKYSKELALKKNPHPKFLFVSNNYHIFRTSLYARKLQMKGEGVGAKTATYYLPSAFIREYIAVLNKLKWVLLGMTLLMVIFILISL